MYTLYINFPCFVMVLLVIFRHEYLLTIPLVQIPFYLFSIPELLLIFDISNVHWENKSVRDKPMTLVNSYISPPVNV